MRVMAGLSHVAEMPPLPGTRPRSRVRYPRRPQPGVHAGAAVVSRGRAETPILSLDAIEDALADTTFLDTPSL